MLRLRLAFVFAVLSIMFISGCGHNARLPEPVGVAAGSNVEIRIGKDGGEMVLIPAGEFQMGGKDGADNEKPLHTIYIDAFYMDKYEVTNAQYRKFLSATGHKAPKYWDDPRYNAPKHPVVGINWYDAMAYAEWAGKRLPTEAEWEKAARGGLSGRKYPWGDKLTHKNANFGGTSGRDRWEHTAPVGSFPPNAYGLYDMTGNVYVWCADWYDQGYYMNSPVSNPTGPDSGILRVLRGGSWHCKDNCLRCAKRYGYHPLETYQLIGFRCVASRSDLVASL